MINIIASIVLTYIIIFHWGELKTSMPMLIIVIAVTLLNILLSYIAIDGVINP